jgi:hypothetical protein
MRKVIAFVLLVVLVAGIPTIAFAAAPSINWQDLNNQEIISVVDAGNRELAQRQAVEEDMVVLADTPEVMIYLTRRYAVNEMNQDSIRLDLETVFVNKTDKEITIMPKYVTLDSWDCTALCMEQLAAGKMKKDKIMINLADAGYSKMEDVKNYEFCFKVYDSSNLLTPIVETEPYNYVR